MTRQPYPRWFWIFAAVTLLLSSAPFIYGLLIRPEAHTYLGVHGNLDDHAVYAAWMKQAQEGRFFFENRFTTDEQPGLTIHLYFWLAGIVSKLTGIPLAMHLFRLIFGLLFLMALYRLVEREANTPFSRATSMALAVFGAGTGWLYFARYGNEGPIDLWQTEAFAFPSLMMHGLFAAALWLILLVWGSILNARKHWKPVFVGALALLALTNIHTYDTMMIAIVGLGFLASQVGARTATPSWIGRTALIAMGAVPALLWFVYVRSQDPVFAARADTETFSPPLHEVLFGLGPLLLMALGAVWMSGYRREPGELPGLSNVAVTGAVVLLVAMALAQAQMAYAATSLWVGPIGWAILALFGALLCYLTKPRNPVYGLLFAWLLMGIIALCYPGLFQRKLAMGLGVPIGLLAGLALAWWLERVPRFETRRLVAIVVVTLLSLTSVRWIEREMLMARDNISKTSVHQIYCEPDVVAIGDYLMANAIPGTVVLAPPGVSIPPGGSYTLDDRAQVVGPDEFLLVLPDLNPVFSGWFGMKTYAGHWSETPNYLQRRDDLARVYDGGDRILAQEILRRTGAEYLVLPLWMGFAIEGELLDYEWVVLGEDWALIRIR